MENKLSAPGIAARIWFRTPLILALGFFIGMIISHKADQAGFLFFGLAAALVVTLPVLAALFIMVPILRALNITWRIRLYLLILLMAFICLCYGVVIGGFGYGSLHTSLPGFVTATALLFISAILALCSFLKRVVYFLSDEEIIPQSFHQAFSLLFFKTNTNNTMEHQQQEYQQMQAPETTHSNRLLIKGLITGGLILIMFIPTIFIQNLVQERAQRQKEVVTEVSDKWAAAQTVSGPFLSVPYSETITGENNTPINVKTQVIVIPDKLTMNGEVYPEERPRSIYKVLLYKTGLQFSGTFKPQWPADINPANLDLAHAKLCFTLTDFKGIEDSVSATVNNQKLLLSPGLPLNDLGETGLSVPVDISAISTGEIPFELNAKLKGSEQLHFIPLSANSKYSLSSTIPNPSFDGNTLPSERTVKDSGFVAQWNFNAANLPFGEVIRSGKLRVAPMAFGVTIVQPADQYNKTMRSVKYSILIIGLSFALFFIIEIMQKKPLHPVQYILVGLALVIFYTLLLSISEFILFDYAYLIAAAATVLLVTFYAKGHFENWRTASIFGISLTVLYAFVFVLIRLEDTALLVGSIGLFIILALVMYASRKIRWYGDNG